MTNVTRGLILLAGLMVPAATLGCYQNERIEHYTVAKPPPSEDPRDPHAGLAIGKGNQQPAGEPTDRTLGAIIPVGDVGWFLKLTGPKDAVAAQGSAFGELIKSVHFSGEGQIEWKLPDGWRQQEGSGMRFATLTIPSEGKPLEVTVIKLPKQAETEAFLLANVNRWRDQLKLPPIEKQQLTADSQQLELTGATATVVNLLGIAAPSNMGRAPFFPGANDGK